MTKLTEYDRYSHLYSTVQYGWANTIFASESAMILKQVSISGLLFSNRTNLFLDLFSWQSPPVIQQAQEQVTAVGAKARQQKLCSTFNLWTELRMTNDQLSWRFDSKSGCYKQHFMLISNSLYGMNLSGNKILRWSVFSPKIIGNKGTLSNYLPK